jgi:integrase
MTIFRDKSNKNRWYAEVPTGKITPSGRPGVTRRSARTKAEAERIERELKSQRDKGLPLPNADLTVTNYLKSWIQQIQSSPLADKTKTSYEQVVRDYLIPRLGTRKLKDLHQRHVQAMQDDLLTQRSANTVRIVKRTLSTALEVAVRNDLIARNVAKLTTPLSVPKRRELRIAPDQLGDFHTAIAGHLHEDIFLFLLHTGVRRGEACGLQWQDLHLDEQPAWVTIRHSYTQTKDGFALTAPKTKTSIRTIVLSSTIAQQLRHRRDVAMQRHHCSSHDQLNEDFVFAGILGTPPRPDTITHQLRTAMDIAGLHGVGPHQLRHLFTTLLLANTENMAAVSNHLGHANIRTTVDIYGHRSQHLLEPLSDIIDTAITQATQNNTSEKDSTNIE